MARSRSLVDGPKYPHLNRADRVGSDLRADTDDAFVNLEGEMDGADARIQALEDAGPATPEGTAIKSTGVPDGRYLRGQGDGSSAWEDWEPVEADTLLATGGCRG